MSRSGGESSVHKVHSHSRKNNPRSGKIHFESNNKFVASFVKVTKKATLYVACTDVYC